jgi:hypothetical protein
MDNQINNELVKRKKKSYFLVNKETNEILFQVVGIVNGNGGTEH